MAGRGRHAGRGPCHAVAPELPPRTPGRGAEGLPPSCPVCGEALDLWDRPTLATRADVPAAAVLGIDQPKVSALVRGKLEGFSTDRLFRFLNALGQVVEIVVRPRRRHSEHATTRVMPA